MVNFAMFYCFMKIINVIRESKGPKTDPCGTPQVTHEVLDTKPLIETNCVWFARFDSNHWFANHNDIIY